jgi:hypothetical protein
VGLTSLGGHPQMVRPLLAPMAEGAAETRYGKLPERLRHKLRAYAAATDNVGLFFGEDIFVAFGAIVLMRPSCARRHRRRAAAHGAVGHPDGDRAFVIHAWRLRRLDQSIARELPRRRKSRRHHRRRAGRPLIMILSIQHLYILVGLILAATAIMTLTDRQHPKRYTSACSGASTRWSSWSATGCRRPGSAWAPSPWR